MSAIRKLGGSRGFGLAWVLVGVLGGGGCAPRALDRVQVGQTTEAQVQAQLGTPAARVQPSERPQAAVLYYADGSRFQLEGGVVQVKSRRPEGAERNLQVWRQRWRAEPLQEASLPGTRGPHGVTERELRAGRLGMAVIYSAQSGEVLEVIQYTGGAR